MSYPDPRAPSSSPSASGPSPAPIAIVGMGGMLPGAPDLDAFYQRIVEGHFAGVSAAARFAFDPARDTKAAPDTVRGDIQCSLGDVEVSAEGLAVSRDALLDMDPSARLAIEAARRAVADAALADVDRARIGVAIGQIALPMQASTALCDDVLLRDLQGALGVPSDAAAAPAAPRAASALSTGTPAAAIAHALGLGGGAMSLDAACASSLYALWFAADALRTGRVDAVVAGGLNQADALYTQMGFSALTALSPRGICAPFDAAGDGLVVGEGAVMFVLRRLSDAEARGERILGVIRGIGVSNDVGGSLLKPEAEGQLRAMRAAYRQAGWAPDDVAMVECHGTGTPAGDAVEVTSLKALWARDDDDSAADVPGTRPAVDCVIGSAKSNVGHLLTGAGAVGLAKVLLALRHKQRLPTANFKAENPRLGLDGSPFRVLSAPEPWPADRPMRAAVSAFGFGGINAHVLVEAHEAHGGMDWGFEATMPDLPGQLGGRTSPGAVPVALTESDEPLGATVLSGSLEPIAVIGMEAWVGPFESTDAVARQLFTADPVAPTPLEARAGRGADRVQGRAGYVIDRVVCAAGRFRIPPMLLADMLPQQLLLLDVADRAMQQAGLRDGLGCAPLFDVGLFAGVELDPGTTNFHLRWKTLASADAWADALGIPAADRAAWTAALADAVSPPLTADRTLGALGGIVASRVAREFRLGGPAFALSAADTSGLAALDRAVAALRAGDVRAAVVGAVDLAADVRTAVAGAGLALPVADGAACVVLKRLSDAVRDGDAVHAVIEGTAMAGGAAAAEALGPHAMTERVRAAAWAQGAGAAALGEGTADAPAQLVLSDMPAAARPAGHGPHGLIAGDATARLGHAGAASGLVQVVAACLSLAHDRLPPSAPAAGEVTNNVVTLAPDGARHLPESTYWLQNRGHDAAADGSAGPARQAEVFNVGREGNVGCAVLAAAPADAQRAVHGPLPVELGAGVIALTAAGPVALATLLERARAVFDTAHSGATSSGATGTPAALEAACAAVRSAMPTTQSAASAPGADGHRIAVVARTAAEMTARLTRAADALRAGQALPLGLHGISYAGPDTREAWSGTTAFVFPGSGNHWTGMGRLLGAQIPGMMAAQNMQNAHLLGQMAHGRFWLGAGEDPVGDDHQDMIFGQVTHGSVVSDAVRAFGLQPGAVIGYSLGESAGNFALGLWQDRDDMFDRVMHSTLFTSDMAGRCDTVRRAWQLAEDDAVDWALSVVAAPRAAVEAAVAAEPRAYLLIVNTHTECVVGGDRAAVERVITALGAKHWPLTGVTTVHCEVAAPVRVPYRNLHLFDTRVPDGLTVYSTPFGAAHTPTRDTAADSILQGALDTLDFPRIIERAYADGVRQFVELGPGSSCTRMIRSILEGRPHLAVAAEAAGKAPGEALLGTLAALFAAGHAVDFTPLSVGHAPTSAIAPEPASAPAGLTVEVPTALPAWALPAVPGRAAGAAARAPDVEPTVRTPRAAPTPSVSAPKPSAPAMPSKAKRPAAPARPATPSMPAAARPAADAAPVFAPVRSEAPVPTANPRPTTPVPAPAQATTAAARVGAPDAEPPADPLAGTLFGGFAAAQAAHGAAHSAFLAQQSTLTQLLMQTMASAASGGVSAVSAALPMQGPAPTMPAPAVPVAAPQAMPTRVPKKMSSNVQSKVPMAPSAPGVFMDRAACLEYARGSIAKVLGPEFAAVDGFPTRVRLPDEPLMLVDRVLEVEGTPKSMTSGRVVTEHDVLEGAWYLDHGRIPTCVAVEAGQADLFLSGYLGIDFETEGHRVYRLLDAEVMFHGGLPVVGQTIHYDIKIHRFFRQGDTTIFKFEFDGTVDGELVITMRDGSAGFFSQDALDSGRGIVKPRLETLPVPGEKPADWQPWAPLEAGLTLDARQMQALRDGDLATAFGPAFAHLPLQSPDRLPGGLMTLAHRVTDIEPGGGRYGLGRIYAEADIHPDDWFLTCHFVDDQVMPGTLMYECCMHTLRILLMRMGMVGEYDQVVIEPVPGAKSRLKCRGQVIASTKVAGYEVALKSIAFGPEPQILCDALMYADGRPIVEIQNMSLRMRGVTRAGLDAMWAAAGAQQPERVAAGTGPRLDAEGVPLDRGTFSTPGAGSGSASGGIPAKPAVWDTDRITAYALGKPSDAFGARYAPFDPGQPRKIARLPGPPFQFLDRVTAARGEPWVLKKGCACEAQYDVPKDAWYFEANRQEDMPFSVLLETALQPCGWLAGYAGSALAANEDVRFRNLGGKATQHRRVTRDSGTLTTQVEMTSVSNSGGMIIQHYAFKLYDTVGLVYEGTTYFGFFSAEALANQVGIRGAKLYTASAEEQARGQAFAIADKAPLSTAKYRMVDRVDLYVPDGGPHGAGFITGSTDVNPERWFFKAHFFEDPVWPGSLGLESMLQLVKADAEKRFGLSEDARFETVVNGAEHSWVYRGQVIPVDDEVTVQATIRAVDTATQTLTADGFLSVDGRDIYEMHGFTVRALASGQSGEGGAA